MGSRAAVVRVVARRRARSRSAATRTASAGWSSWALDAVDAATDALEGLAHRARLGTARHRVLRSGGRTAAAADRARPGDGRTGSARRRGAHPPSSTRVACPSPTPVTWPGDDGATVHGLLSATARDAEPPHRWPPLLVDVHGGPTDQATVDWKPRIRWFVSRGWAVLAPNYRGSTGYGRDYRQALDHAWGELDVADTVAGIRAARRSDGWCDARRAAVMGGSAGRPHRAARRRARTPPWCARR